MPGQQNLGSERGKRAEEVASWYFRLNGFLTIPGFVVHPDQLRRFPRTEADLLGVRFPYSREFISDRQMNDDALLAGIDNSGHRTVFVLVEVKTDLCNINGPWSNRDEKNVHRVLRRLGFAEESLVNEIAESMYDTARWEDGATVLQYVCVGARKNDGKQRQFPNLVQINWSEVAEFLWARFAAFPEKLPDGRPVHEQWPDFGQEYGEWVNRMRYANAQPADTNVRSLSAVSSYISSGSCVPA